MTGRMPGRSRRRYSVSNCREARRGLRRAVKLGLLLAVVGVVAMVVMSKRSEHDARET